MTDTLARVRAALDALCARANVEPGDQSAAAARAVVGVLRRTGCFDAPAFGDERHMPDCCPVAVWVRLETGLAVYVSSGTDRGRGKPGRAVLLGDLVPTGDPRVPARREREVVELPPAVDGAVVLIDAKHGADQDASKEAA